MLVITIIEESVDIEEMTEVFISAMSTTRIELNQQEQEFYRDEKQKEIYEVRVSLDYLHLFGQFSAKERMQADLPLVWKAINYLAKILGYEADFTQINKLHLSSAVLLHDLLFVKDIFAQKAYRSLQIIDRWDCESDKYIILLSGVIEREVFRNSILELNIDQFIRRTEGGYKPRKNAKRKYMRNEQQIPICVNSKRSQLRGTEVSSGVYRSVTCSETFQINMSSWKKYVSSFKKMQENCLQTFIKKHLNIDIPLVENPVQAAHPPIVANSQTAKEQEKGQNNLADLYSIENCCRKERIQLDNRSIVLLFHGEMTVKTLHYQVQSSPGCVLNSQIYQQLSTPTNKFSHYGSAYANSQSTIIRLNISKLDYRIGQNWEEQECLQALLRRLEESRKNKIDVLQMAKRCNNILPQFLIQKQPLSVTAKLTFSEQTSLNLRNSISKDVNISPKRTLYVSRSKPQLNRNKLCQNQLDNRHSKVKLFECMAIEDQVEKRQQLADKIKQQYLKNTRKTEPSKLTKAQINQCQSYNILNSVLLKDSIMQIQARSQCLKKTLIEKKKQNRDKKGDEPPSAEISFVGSNQNQKVLRNTSTDILKKKIKEIYLKTQEDGQDYLPYLENVSERVRHKDKGNFITWKNSCEQDIWTSYGQYMPKGRGVIKKVQKGQLRRVKIR